MRTKQAAHWKLFDKNCATAVARILKAGGGDEFATPNQKQLVWWPTDLLKYARSIGQRLSHQLVLFKPGSLHTPRISRETDAVESIAAIMNIMLIALGTAGDVFPLIGLGRILRQRGDEVHIASSNQFQGAVEQSGLPFHLLAGIPRLTDDPDAYHPTRSMRVVTERLIIPSLKPVYDLLSTLNPAEWRIVANCHSYGARLAQEKHGFDLTTCLASPFHLRSIQQLPVTPGFACPSWAPAILRRAFFGMVAGMWDRELGPQVNEYRKTLGLQPVRDIWYGWCLSPDRVLGLFPEWFAPRQTDWPPQVIYGGFMAFDQGAAGELPDVLREPGPPLVVVAAGSAGEIARTLFNAAIAASTGQPWRAVLLTGKDNPASDTPVPPNVFRYPFIPMSRLMPMSSAIVHHGGIGTISHALTAGVPQVAVPFGHDQFDNTARIEGLGVGKSILKPKDLAGNLRRVITELLGNGTTRARCREFQKRLSEDTSLIRVCEQIDSRLLGDNQRKSANKS